jgi:hypothetical protein
MFDQFGTIAHASISICKQLSLTKEFKESYAGQTSTNPAVFSGKTQSYGIL